jgi:hypothetical protein
VSPISDTVIVSTDNSSMCDFPVAIQATGGDAALEYSAQDHFRSVLDALYVSPGRVGYSAMKATQRAAGANFSVDLSSGYFVVSGTSVAFQGKYLVWTTAVINVVVPSAPVSGTRIHRLYIEILDKQITGSAYGWQIKLDEDDGSGTPSLPANAANIALISVAAGAGSVSTSMITDNALTAVTQHGGPGQIILREYAAGGSNFISTAAASITYTGMSSGQVRITAGNRYRVKFRVTYALSVGVEAIWTIAKATTSSGSGPSIGSELSKTSVNASYSDHQIVETEFTATASESIYFNLAVQLDGGGTVIVQRGAAGDLSYVSVDDLGPVSDRVFYQTGA